MTDSAYGQYSTRLMNATYTHTAILSKVESGLVKVLCHTVKSNLIKSKL